MRHSPQSFFTLVSLFPALFLPAVTRAAQSDDIRPPSYVCQRASTPPIIDGKLDDPVWQNALTTQPFLDIEGKSQPAPPQGTSVRMVWDDDFLYIAARLEEKHVWGTLKTRDCIIYQDPDFEVFIDPSGQGKNYLELEVNALGTVWDLFLPYPYRSAHALPLHDWDIKGLRHAVHIDGTLNNASDTDQGWNVELAIPWSSITGHQNQPRAGTPPKPGDSMRMNFSRVGWQVKADPAAPSGYAKITGPDGKPLPESNHVWAPTGKINIHMPEYWGRVVFSGRPSGVWEAPPSDPDEELRLELYRFYRDQLALAHKSGGQATNTLSDLRGGKSGAWTLKGKNLAAIARYSQAARKRWVLEITSPWSGRDWVITDEGCASASPAPANLPPKVFLWIHGKDDPENTRLWRKRFASYRDSGVDAVIIDDTSANIARLTALAREAGLEAYAWMWTLNRPWVEEILRHPDWFAVSRSGKSCHTEATRPYVAYYQFLCPNNPQVRDYLVDAMRKYCTIPGISGVQIDYIRMPDVILPEGLWKKYGLVMDRELPDYDFCYCPNCQKAFQAKFGRSVKDDPASDPEWRQFRLDSVRQVAALLAETARQNRLECAAAVFPTPAIARSKVRQPWDEFPLDFVFTMTYNSFYGQPDSWVGDKIREANAAISGRFAVNPGFHLPDLKSENHLERQLDLAWNSGARGFGIFSHEVFDEHFQSQLKSWKERIFKANSENRSQVTKKSRN